MSYHFNGILAIDRYSSLDPQGAVVSIIADSESDLPSVATVATDWLVTMIIGSQGKAVDTGADYLLDSNGTWVKQPGQIFENTYDKDEIDSLLSGKQDTLTFDTIPTEDSTNPVESGGIWSPLSELVDNGAKNFANSTIGSATQILDIPCRNIPPGKYIVFFQSVSSTDTDASVCQIYGMDSAKQNLTSARATISRGTDQNSTTLTVNADTAYIRLYASDSLAHSSGDTVSYTGAMVCTETQWNISQSFESYGMTNSELTVQKVTMDDIYGLGTLIPNNSDLNDYTTPGSYYVVNNANANTILHKPIGGSGFRLIVSYTSAANRQRQEFIKPNQPENIYVRNVGTDGNWSNWFVFTGTDTGA